MLKQIPSTSLPLFDVTTNITAQDEKLEKLTLVNKSSFVQIQYGDKMLYV